MHKVEKVEAFGRNLRTDDTLEELGRSSYDVLREMINKGEDKEKVLNFIDYVQHEFKWLHDLYCDWAYADLDYVAKKYGEEEIPEMLRHARKILMKTAYKGQGQVQTIDIIRLFCRRDAGPSLRTRRERQYQNMGRKRSLCDGI